MCNMWSKAQKIGQFGQHFDLKRILSTKNKAIRADDAIIFKEHYNSNALVLCRARQGKCIKISLHKLI